MSSTNNRGNRNRQANPAEQSVDMAQREQAMRLIQMLAGQGGGQQQYQPILKSLKAIGIEPHQMTVMVGDEPTDCLVIPMQDLMTKEWLHMSGQDVGGKPVTETENS